MNFGRVHPGEWVVSLCGALILVALFMPWHGEESALSRVGLPDAILAILGLASLALPLTLALTRTTNIPIVTETFISTAATIVSLVLLFKVVWPPEGGLKAGFYLGLAGSVLLTISGWKSTSRQA